MQAIKTDNDSKKSLENIFGGERTLRKMLNFSSSDSKWSIGGAYFMIAGAIVGEGSTKTDFFIHFYWKTNDGSFSPNRLAWNRIRVNPVPNSREVVPTIRFILKSGGFTRFHNETSIQKLIDNNVLYAIITCNERDWPSDVQLPMNDLPVSLNK